MDYYLFCRYVKGKSPSDVEIIFPTIFQKGLDTRLEKCFIKKEELLLSEKRGFINEGLVKVVYAQNLGYSIRIGIKDNNGAIIQFEVPRDSIQDFILSPK